MKVFSPSKQNSLYTNIHTHTRTTRHAPIRSLYVLFCKLIELNYGFLYNAYIVCLILYIYIYI